MEVLVKFRNGMGQSAKGMAELIGVSQSYYEKVEYNQKKPSREFMMKFKKVFPTFDIDLFFNEMLQETSENHTQQEERV